MARVHRRTREGRDTRAGAAGMTGQARRILIVMPLGTALGGGEQMLRQLLAHGRDRGVEWRVAFLRDGPMVEEARRWGIACEVVAAGRFRDLFTRLGAIRRLVALARDADAVMGWMVAGQAMAGLAAFIAGRPCVWYQVGTPRPDWLDAVATALPACGTLVLSRDGERAQRRLKPSRPVRLVYPGAALDVIEAVRTRPPGELRRRLGLPDGPLVGIVGRLQRWKGMHVFVEALAIARRTRPDVRGVIVGGPHETEPAYGDELRDQARRLGIESAITFAGFQSNAAEWMQAMDVVVHASDHEPFGIVVVEAMALGKPVVAGAAGGPSEIITDGVNGLLSPYGDANALASAIGRLLDDPGFAGRLGDAARVRAADFGEAAYARNVTAAVLALLDGRP
jgi:hypothetical protein